MRWHKFISSILHPIVMPTIGTLLYFIINNNNISTEKQYVVLSIVFLATYIIPLLLLVFLKAIGYIKSFQVKTIEERKVPLFFMIALFFALGKVFSKNYFTRDLSYLFYGTVLGMIIVYCIFFTKTKTSLHLLSSGSAVGYFLTLNMKYGISDLWIVITFIILSGFLASSRLHLNAHTPKEVYLGFFIGIFSQFLVLSIL